MVMSPMIYLRAARLLMFNEFSFYSFELVHVHPDLMLYFHLRGMKELYSRKGNFEYIVREGVILLLIIA